MYNGHAHPEHLIEIGYVLPDTRKSNNIQFADLLYGQTTSFGGRLQSHGYATFPSHIHKYPFKDTIYFHGGYCIQKYGSQYIEHVVDAIP
ncbi:hypothetical protein C2G38_2211856 [Gigaspora rosea]|uniref:Uncharacterized protein n=1 Tax=Gigaspora rosea TaxID=44941 RepID=A0A397UDG9_9GLOM|nr:hypothetical protein C2G38_2211856 [Gigaspora rosea]